MTDKPLDHVIRPTLPWREDSLTECGKALDSVNVITGDEYMRRLAEWGKQRTSLFVCVTCMNCAGGGTWETRPGAVLMREVRRVFEFLGSREPHTQESIQFTNELRALSLLVEAHREEFYSYLAGLSGAASIAEARRRRSERANER